MKWVCRNRKLHEGFQFPTLLKYIVSNTGSDMAEQEVIALINSDGARRFQTRLL